MRSVVRIAIVFLLLVLADAGVSAPAWPAERPPPSVLILNSYHQGYEWSDNEIEGVLEGLRSAYPEITPAIEHLDLKRFPAADHPARLRSYLSGKYRNHRIDLALILDNPALDIVLKHRDEILPGVPVVFAGINDFTPGMLRGQSGITGIAEVQDHHGTLALALNLHPGTRRVLAVHDYTASGLAVRHEMEAVLPDFLDRVQVDFNDPATYEEMARQIAALPTGSLALILSFATDRAGRALTPEQSTAGADGARPRARLCHARDPPRTRHRRWHAARRRGARASRRSAGHAGCSRAKIPRRFRSRPTPPPARCSTTFNWSGSGSLQRRFRPAVSS